MENKKKIDMNHLNKSLASVLVDTYFSDIKPLANWYRKQLDIRNIVLDHNFLFSREARDSEKYTNCLEGVCIPSEDLKGINSGGDLCKLLNNSKYEFDPFMGKVNTMSLRMKENMLETYVMINSDDAGDDNNNLVKEKGRRKIKVFSFDEFMSAIKKGLKTKNEMYFEKSSYGKIAFGINGFVSEDLFIPIYGVYQISRNLKAEFYMPNIGKAAREVVNKQKIDRRIRIGYDTEIEALVGITMFSDSIHKVYSPKMVKEQAKMYNLLEDMRNEFLKNYETRIFKELINVVLTERTSIYGGDFINQKTINKSILKLSKKNKIK